VRACYFRVCCVSTLCCCILAHIVVGFCVPTLWCFTLTQIIAVFASVAAISGVSVSATPSSGAMQQEQALLEALGRWADRLAMVNEVFGSKIV
jgi:hypothetical protein